MSVDEAPKASRREWIALAVIALPCLLYSMDLIVLELALCRRGVSLPSYPGSPLCPRRWAAWHGLWRRKEELASRYLHDPCSWVLFSFFTRTRQRPRPKIRAGTLRTSGTRDKRRSQRGGAIGCSERSTLASTRHWIWV